MSLRTRLVLLFTLAALVVGVAGGLLLARRLQLGLESDLDGVMRQRAAAVVAKVVAHPPGSPGSSGQSGQSGWVPDLTEAEGPVQLLSGDGEVLASAGGASPVLPLLDAERRRRAMIGVFIVDEVAHVGSHQETVRVLGRPAGSGRLLALAIDRTPVDDVVDRTGVELGLLGAPALALIAFGVWLVTGAALRPVERMRAQAAAATPGDPTVLTVPPGGDELARLAVTLNDLLAAQQAALRAEQSFLADAGHELRTPLAILAGELEYADRPARSLAELRETVTVAREETNRLVRLAEQLLVLARIDGNTLNCGEVDLRALSGTAVTAWAATARAVGVDVVLSPGNPARAWVDADRLRQLLDNLLANAVRAAPAGSAVEITVTRLASLAGCDNGGRDNSGRGDSGREDSGGEDGGGSVELTVRDHGPGFEPGFLPYAFERFRRADLARARSGPAVPGGSADGAGSGLGLAVVRSIAENHGGTAEAGNLPDGGAVVRVRLPVAPAGREPGRPSGEPSDDGSPPVGWPLA